MKKLGSIILSICSLFLLSGCMKYDISMKVNEDKSMELEMIYAFDQQAIMNMMSSMKNTDTNSTDTTIDEDDIVDEDIDLDDTDSEVTDLDDADSEDDTDISDEDLSSMTDTNDTKEILEKRGYKVEDYSEGNYEGFKATLKIDNIDNVSSEKDLEVIFSNILKEDFDDEEFFTVKKGFLKNTYTANFVYENDDASSLTGYGMVNLDLQYSIELPSKSLSNNASSVDGNKLTWNIKMDEETNIKYSFEMPNKTNIMILIIAGIVLLAVVIIIVVVAITSSKKKHNKKINTEKKEQPIIVNTTEEVTNTIKTCPNCGTQVEETDKFCLNCGKQL